jgi:ureidoglycolate lyase
VSATTTHRLQVTPLTRAAFAPFGDVIETQGSQHYAINKGSTIRFHDLARIDVTEGVGHALLSIFRAAPLPSPIEIKLLERHPLGSQAFIPLAERRFLVVVADPVANPGSQHLHAFVSNGRQGVNYHRNTWHHFALALDQVTDFLVVDRGGPGENCDEIRLVESAVIHFE